MIFIYLYIPLWHKYILVCTSTYWYVLSHQTLILSFIWEQCFTMFQYQCTHPPCTVHDIQCSKVIKHWLFNVWEILCSSMYILVKISTYQYIPVHTSIYYTSLQIRCILPCNNQVPHSTVTMTSSFTYQCINVYTNMYLYTQVYMGL